MFSKSHCRSHGLLDSLAISMSMICALHCLLTPVFIVSLPILATSVWIHEDFHLWMILFVIPTTSLAVFMGCKKHKDKAVFFLSMIGLILLSSVAVYETVFHSELVFSEHSQCAHCTARSNGSILTASTFINIMGGILLSSAHVRNYILCRQLRCNHEK